AIVTNGGGAGVLTTDEVISSGLIMARLDDGTIMKLRNVLPEAASPYNPVDILGDAPAERYIKSIKIVMNDNNVDSIIIITIMQSPAFNPKEFIEGMKEIIEKTEKPMLMIAPGGEYTEKWSIEIERELRIPVFKSPEECVKALVILTRFGDILRRYRQ
ncbi:MAG: CoA-binding protein, partial [Desulfurococcales archaeon ex4484_42]